MRTEEVIRDDIAKVKVKLDVVTEVIKGYVKEESKLLSDIRTGAGKKGSLVVERKKAIKPAVIGRLTRQILIIDKKLDGIRKKRSEVYVLRYKTEQTQIKLTHDLEDLENELKKIPELIDLDEETGYLIYYSRIKKSYFLVHPEEYEETGGNIVEARKKRVYFKSLTVAVNFTFDTLRQEKYPGEDEENRRLEAEIRLIIKVRGAGNILAKTIADKMKLAYERYITFKFEENAAGGSWKKMTHTIADRREDTDERPNIDIVRETIRMLDYIKEKLLVYKRKGLEITLKEKEEYDRMLKLKVRMLQEIKDYKVKDKRIEAMKHILPEVLKVGAYYRISKDEPTMDIDAEKAEPEIYGEWARALGGVYTRVETFDYESLLEKFRETEPTEYDARIRANDAAFNMEYQMSQQLEWITRLDVEEGETIGEFSGETGWQQLHRIKKEEEER